MVERSGEDTFLTRAEVAALMRLDRRTLDNMAARRQGPPYVRTNTLRGRALYRKSDVLAFLESNRGGPAPAASTPAKRTNRRKATAKG